MSNMWGSWTASKIIAPSGAAMAAVLPTGVGPATTFDPAHNTNAILSNSNRTITAAITTNLGCYSIARTVPNQKVYVEATINLLTYSCNIGFGSDNTLGSRSDGSSVTPTPGFEAIQAGFFSDLDSPDHGVSWSATSAISGSQIDVALDLSINRVWYRLNNSAWNPAMSGTQDPATGQGGLRVVISVGNPQLLYFFCGEDANAGEGWTARFAVSDWLHTPPVGFSQLSA
jgi:hypothetical protein